MKTFGEIKKGESIYEINANDGSVSELTVCSIIDSIQSVMCSIVDSSENDRKAIFHLKNGDKKSAYCFDKNNLIVSSKTNDVMWVADFELVKFGQFMFNNGTKHVMNKIMNLVK